ncbi:MAG: hypothetical protein EOO61_01090 [Hymenobacter sp.]|nr:MAG: hypothetical protein EOO61_01090 [Hymenobacter sp.]
METNSSKPKIFIGSSTTGYKVAEKVKICLASVGDCTLWKESGVWELNRSTFENLLRMANYFDFGIFVATADDLTMTNERLVIEPRDNVILEMALFLGAMGRDKSFLLVEGGVKLPTDFAGIYMPHFNPKNAKSITNACKEIGDKINEHYQLGHLSLYPTTALAIGYYKNFIEGLVSSIQENPNLSHEGHSFNEFKVKVVVPKNLHGSVKDKARHFYRRNNLIESSLKTSYRNHPAWFHLQKSEPPVGIIYDMPTTLTGIDEAVELILQRGYQGRTAMQNIIEERELNNFRRVLQMQLDSNPFAKEIVEIVDEF